MRLHLGGPSAELAELVLFPFDDHSLPFNHGLLLTLVPGNKTPFNIGHGFDPDHPGEPVLTPGEPGSPDCDEVILIGSVIKIGSEYRMWYAGQGDQDGVRRVCYATSTDGFRWEKPDLGLMEYGGSSHNNLVHLTHEGENQIAPWVLYDPEAADPQRRYKMIYEDTPFNICAVFSPDGLHWTRSKHNPVIGRLEPGGLVKFNGCYYVNGQGGVIPHPVPGARKRSMVTYASYDFEHWTKAVAMSFTRTNVPPRLPTDFEPHRGEQVHQGASVWNRGNVLVGFYGQYHNESNDRRFSTLDLGLCVSNDALHYREPVPDFKMIPAYEETDGAWPRLLQGQAFENIGERTVYWYSVWRGTPYSTKTPTGVRVATWQRDRLGYLSAGFQAAEAHLISSAISLEGRATRVLLNVDGVSEASYLTVEVLDEQFRTVPGYSAEECRPIDSEGFRQPVTWGDRKDLADVGSPVRIRVDWMGARPEDVRLFAVYVS